MRPAKLALFDRLVVVAAVLVGDQYALKVMSKLYIQTQTRREL
jgi:hypothetical protein